MKLLFIVDGRSPIALNWIEYFLHTKHEVHVVSTYPCTTVEGVASQFVVPVALSNFYGLSKPGGYGRLGFLRRLLPVRVRTVIRRMAAPLSLPQAIARLQGILQRLQPELIHAMRIPFEGMLAAEALKETHNGNPATKFPLLISVWGNDFTLHAESTQAMAARTRQAMQICDALHTDCQRDQRLAITWGFDARKPKIVLPGGGGVKREIFYPPGMVEAEEHKPAPVTIINPRGFRAYVRNDTFFQSIPMVIEAHPEVHFVCPDMQDEGQAHGWVAELGIADKVDLLPAQSRQQMAELFRQAQISLSITTHDGTPNTLLEAMACGCFPIAGDIEALREWIRPGVNGLLVDPGNPEALAKAIISCIDQPEMRRQAIERNILLVRERADYGNCMNEVEEFYNLLISGG